MGQLNATGHSSITIVLLVKLTFKIRKRNCLSILQCKIHSISISVAIMWDLVN